MEEHALVREVSVDAAGSGVRNHVPENRSRIAVSIGICVVQQRSVVLGGDG